jgi:predicted PurR-regulated permease PerM
MMQQAPSIQRPLYIVFFFFLGSAAMFFAKPFLVPLCFGGLLSMLFLPVSRWLQRKGLIKGLAILTCVIAFVAIIVAIVWLITWQVTDLTSDLGSIEQKLNKIISELKQTINKNFGITPKQQDELLKNNNSTSGGVSSYVSSIGSGMMSFVVDFILVLVYIFLFMYYRGHIKKFILQLIPSREKINAEEIISGIQKVSQQYLTGLSLMIVGLWIMYSIGFSIVGVKFPVFFAIVCGLLEIVPFVGNLTGNLLAVLMVVVQGGGTGMIFGVLITYATVQFFQTYILEPLVVGAEVNINPLFTIIILVAGELVWGIPGMVLAIPLLGIVKIICDHIEPLKPYGFLIGQEKKKKQGLIGKMKKIKRS